MSFENTDSYKKHVVMLLEKTDESKIKTELNDILNEFIKINQ